MAHEAIVDTMGDATCDVPLAPVIAVDFAEFFAATRQPMLRLAFLLTGSAADAEETVQESYVRVYERWSQIEDPGAYLRRAIINRSSSRFRHRATARRAQPRLAVGGSYLDQPDELFDALASLPARRRAVIVLRFYDRLELAEIADVLGISTGTVKSTLHRALAQMKGNLE